MEEQPKLAIYTDNVEAQAFISDRFPQVKVRITDRAEEFIEVARDAEIIFLSRKYERSTVLALRHLKWLHLGGTGIDRLRPLSDLDSEIIITHTPGLNAEMIADYVICVTLMLTWDFPRLIRNQLERRWERWLVDRAEDKTLALIGLGNIGRAVARKATAMGMRVIGVKRSPDSVPGVEYVVGPDQLHEILGEADFVVLAVPLTGETWGMIGPREFLTMKETACLINICRGAVVQEQALIEALKKRRIAGAALDVFENEPLPGDSELWGLENVIISPHISSWSRGYRARAAEVFCANLQRYLSHQPLLYVIDRSREY
jgi:phosphoglycerate dehydrogenase-like enzyme